MTPAGCETDARETRRETIAFHLYRSVAWLARTLPEDARPAAVPVRRAGSRATSRPPRERWWPATRPRCSGRAPGDPLVRAATREAFDSYARYWFDSFRFAVMAPAAVAARFEAIGDDHLWHALDDGRGAIVALPHIGNWDAAGPWLSSMGRRVVAVAEQLRPPRLYELFVANRTVVRGGGGRSRRRGGRDGRWRNGSPTARSWPSSPTATSRGGGSR